MQRRVLFVAAIFVLLFLFQAGELRAAGPGATYEWISGSYRADIELTSNSAPDEEMYSGHFDFELRWSTHKRMLYYTHGGKHDAVDWDGNTGHATFTTKHRSEVTKTASLSFMPDRSIKVSVRIQSPRSRFKVFHDYQGTGATAPRQGAPSSLGLAPLSNVKNVKVLNIAGEVDFMPKGIESGSRPLQPGDMISDNDAIYTGIGASVTLQFENGTIVTLKELTHMRVASIRSTEKSIQTKLLVLAGQVTAKVDKGMTTESDFQIRTPTVTAGVRGTEFSVRHIKEPRSTSVVKVTEGRVLITPGNKSLEPRVLQAGSEAKVTDEKISTTGPVLPADTPFEQIMPGDRRGGPGTGAHTEEASSDAEDAPVENPAHVLQRGEPAAADDLGPPVLGTDPAN